MVLDSWRRVLLVTKIDDLLAVGLGEFILALLNVDMRGVDALLLSGVLDDPGDGDKFGLAFGESLDGVILAVDCNLVIAGDLAVDGDGETLMLRLVTGVDVCDTGFLIFLITRGGVARSLYF